MLRKGSEIIWRVILIMLMVYATIGLFAFTYAAVLNAIYALR